MNPPPLSRTAGKHTPRTAQAFEEFVLGSDKSSISRVLGIGLMSFKRTVTNLEAMLGRDRLMLVTQEELEVRTGTALFCFDMHHGMMHAVRRADGLNHVLA